MRLTSLEIRKQEFDRAFRGFAPGDVESFLHEVAATVDDLEKDNAELKLKLRDLESQAKDFRSVERVFQQTLLQAQETTDKTLDTARRQAQLLVAEAERKAAEIVERARAGVTGMKEQLTILLAKRDSIIARLRILLQSELDFLKTLEHEEEAARSERTSPSVEADIFKAEIGDILRSIDQV